MRTATPLAITLTIATLATFLALPAREADAAFSINAYFGGSILSVMYCTCIADYGMVLTVRPPGGFGIPKNVFYKPGVSKLRANYNIFTPGPYVLGSYTRVPKLCMEQGTAFCIPTWMTAEGTVDSMIGIGSSGF